MNHSGSIWAPFFSAAAVPAAIVWLFYMIAGGWPDPLSSALTLLLLTALIAGLGLFPALFLLTRIRWLNFWSLLAAGFVVGCIPMSILKWPHNQSAVSVATWRLYTETVLFFGACGVSGALAYWATARYVMRSNNRWRGP